MLFLLMSFRKSSQLSQKARRIVVAFYSLLFVTVPIVTYYDEKHLLPRWVNWIPWGIVFVVLAIKLIQKKIKERHETIVTQNLNQMTNL